MSNTLDIRAMVLKGVPSILMWNRLEGRPRKINFDRSLKAEVRDPLWMLTRQWQMGEFKGDDAGSPVFAKTQIKSTKLTRYKSLYGDVEPIDSVVPLETKVETENLDKTYQLSLEISSYWFKLLKSSGIYKYKPEYILEYKFELPTKNKDNSDVFAHKEVWQSLQAMVGRAMDGVSFITHLLGGGSALDGVTPDPGDDVKLNEAAEKLVAWFSRQYYLPSEQKSETWKPEQLEYQFKCSAPKEDGGQTVLSADEYYQGRLDWYSFNIEDKHAPLVEPAGVIINDNVQKKETLSFIPTPVEFGGMPNLRWWEFEDNRTDFGDIDANTTDLAKLLLIEFGLVYANDWFVIPYVVDEGVLVNVNGLRITDNFGRNIWIDPSGKGAENNWEGFNMFTLSKKSKTGFADLNLFIPPAISMIKESDAFEEIKMIRDEVANMVWGIENKVLLNNGTAIPGTEAAYQTVDYLRSLIVAPAVIESENDASIMYKLQSTVPENWIPFIPVHVDGSNREIQLRRAAMLRTLENDNSNEKIEARTKFFRQGYTDSTPYYIHEEEVPRAGIKVNRKFQRARWHNGKVYTWVGRRKQTGRGEGSSGLKFDYLEQKAK